MIEFFLPMVPPTVTQQEHKVAVSRKTGQIRFYDPPELKAARAQLMDSVGRYAPAVPIRGPVQLVTKWIWPADRSRMQMMSELDPDYHEWKTTKPDTDNLIKMLKDCMTRTGFWMDDAQVASEVTEKFLAYRPGIYVRVTELDT